MISANSGFCCSIFSTPVRDGANLLTLVLTQILEGRLWLYKWITEDASPSITRI